MMSASPLPSGDFGGLLAFFLDLGTRLGRLGHRRVDAAFVAARDLTGLHRVLGLALDLVTGLRGLVVHRRAVGLALAGGRLRGFLGLGLDLFARLVLRDRRAETDGQGEQGRQGHKGFLHADLHQMRQVHRPPVHHAGAGTPTPSA
ncbi:MAG: hypothetical protein MZW92_13930 [Comamonadaceae bacterium]|nr:hypothetical protein [Comamonadaceae bacterium]